MTNGRAKKHVLILNRNLIPMARLFTLLTLILTINGFSQLGLPSAPSGTSTGTIPDWNVPIAKEAVDTCGPYFNNYVGLTKTSLLFFEELRTGSGADFTPYTGRGQRFHAPQEIEVSGIQFYSFQTNTELDSLPVVTVLYDWDEDLDSTGAELARDTVWVSHTEFTPLLPDLEVDSYFDEPVIVSEDYIVALYTYTDDSLKIITNDPDGDGEDEGVSFAYYENPVAPSFTGWYQTLETFGAGYDIDYLINPLVTFELHDDFTITNDTVCPNIVSATCADYVQKPVFSDPHYNALYDMPASRITWDWGDGLQNTGLTSLCHTYLESGEFEITLIDTLRRHEFFEFNCTVELTDTVLVLDSTTVEITGMGTMGLSGIFDQDVTNADSILWDFGDGNQTDEFSPTHVYDAIGDYNVWVYAYGPCNTDSAMTTVTISDVGIDEAGLNISIYPNPANSQVIVSGIQPGTQVELLNILGQPIYEKIAVKSTIDFNTSQLSEGAYFIRIANEQGQSSRKLIVKH